MNFRNDIAGLRSLAVLPIVLFHAGLNFIPGGFTGVDTFFVISGYLITMILMRDIDQNNFSILSFYRKRIARILPALFTVIMFFSIVSYFILLPTEMVDLRSSAISALTFISNFYFMLNVDYFTVDAETAPLLHTWSLSVEEQFYFFYPIFLLIMVKWQPRFLRLSIIVLSIFSFIAALALGQMYEKVSFYMFPTRAWELGMGALVALGAFPKIKSETGRNIAACVGLLLIIASLFLVKEGPLFPAPLAMFPALGAALIISYAERTTIGNILSLNPIKWFGDLSYSLYLWHWPIITFYRLNYGMDLNLWETFALVVVSVFAARLTYQFIEKPCIYGIRNANYSDLKVNIFGAASIIAVCLFVVSIYPLYSQFREIPSDPSRVASFLKYTETSEEKFQFRGGECFIRDGDKPQLADDCLKISKDIPNMIVLGDSHAAHLWRAISERYSFFNVMQATASGCRPLLNSVGIERCTDLMRYVFDEVIPTKEVQTVVLSARWKENEVPLLKETIRYLIGNNMNVIVLGPTVEYSSDIPRVLARAMLSNDIDNINNLRVSEREFLDERIEEISLESGAEFISIHDIICDGAHCKLMTKSRDPYQFDYGHLTLSASREIVEKFPNIVFPSNFGGI